MHAHASPVVPALPLCMYEHSEMKCVDVIICRCYRSIDQDMLSYAGAIDQDVLSYAGAIDEDMLSYAGAIDEDKVSYSSLPGIVRNARRS